MFTAKKFLLIFFATTSFLPLKGMDVSERMVKPS